MAGWNDDGDSEEEAKIKVVFERTDTDGSGELDRQEVQKLFKDLNIQLTSKQFDVCFSELDKMGEGTVDFVEFSWWWFLTKYGKPRLPPSARCSTRFLESL